MQGNKCHEDTLTQSGKVRSRDERQKMNAGTAKAESPMQAKSVGRLHTPLQTERSCKIMHLRVTRHNISESPRTN